MNDITHLLRAIEQGEPHAADQLLPLVYDELRRLAREKLAREQPGQTLDATALVHEAYLRLVASDEPSAAAESQWDSRGHFFAAAATAMRRILVERARRKKRVKHGAGRQQVPLDNIKAAPERPSDDLVALDEALTQLAAVDPVKARLVELRFFAGLSVEEAARCLGVSRATADRY